MAVNLWKAFILTVLSVCVIKSRVGYYIVTPLWFDYFKLATFDFANVTNGSQSENDTMTIVPLLSGRSISATFLLVGQFGFVAIWTGFILLAMMLGCPKTLSSTNYQYQWRIQDFPLGGAPTRWGGGQPLTRTLFGKNVCENERN